MNIEVDCFLTNFYFHHIAPPNRASAHSEASKPTVANRPGTVHTHPQETLSCISGEPSGPATLGGSLELEARPETTVGHMRVGALQARAVHSEPINRLHKLFIRPPSRQRPPPEALCLGDIEADTAEKSFREIYSSSDCESP
jgi:hypothetical protein